MCGQLRDGINKSVTKLKQSLDSGRRAAAREITKTLSSKETAALSKVKQQAAAAAEKIKEDAGKPKSIFMISSEEYERRHINPAPRFSQKSDQPPGALADLSLPLLITGGELIQKWRDSPKSQLAAVALGGGGGTKPQGPPNVTVSVRCR